MQRAVQLIRHGMPQLGEGPIYQRPAKHPETLPWRRQTAIIERPKSNADGHRLWPARSWPWLAGIRASAARGIGGWAEDSQSFSSAFIISSIAALQFQRPVVLISPLQLCGCEESIDNQGGAEILPRIPGKASRLHTRRFRGDGDKNVRRWGAVGGVTGGKRANGGLSPVDTTIAPVGDRPRYLSEITVDPSSHPSKPPPQNGCWWWWWCIIFPSFEAAPNDPPLFGVLRTGYGNA